ncbi:MAG: ribosomal RNA small subunit methyltransferase A [Promethearchaeota archaeon]|nr:MAG: ribosomal RNA small subunit methyltransferase A [Candidatus Lokiarchaeota archaeon]
MNRNDTLSILKQLKLSPKKKLGQNFLIDENILKKIISISELTSDDIVLEIGAGLGALTFQLSTLVDKVYAYEIDKTLYQYLKTKFSSSPNIQLINEDILNANIPPHNKVVSNIPYSITGPILEKIFYKVSPPVGTLIIEKSLANRIFLKNSYKNFSRISINFNAFMIPMQKVSISPNAFYPSPKIELSMIKVLPRADIHPFLKSKETRAFFLEFISGIMPYKNKNLSNAIHSYLNTIKSDLISKNELKQYLASIDFDDIKLSQFKYDDFIVLSEKFYELLDQKMKGEF